jgi:hypothetical protein
LGNHDLISWAKWFIFDLNSACDMKVTPAILVFFVAVILTACSKDKFETKPLLKVKSYSSKEVFQGQTLNIRITYTDKEGDLSLAPLYARRIRLNVRALGSSDNDKSDSLDTHLPEFPNKNTGEINYQQGFDFLKESISENDTLVFKFAVLDKAGHASDTITTSPIVIHLP